MTRRVAVGSRANTLRQKGDAVFSVFSSREVSESRSVRIELGGVRHPFRHTKHHAAFAVNAGTSGEIASARITASGAKRLTANAFREAA